MVAGCVWLAHVAGAMGADPFSVILLPDTQHYTEMSPVDNIYSIQTTWIVNNVEAEDIKFVTHLGDIVEDRNTDPSQWAIAREAARRMQCGNNMKQIVLALASYENAFGVYPPSRIGCDGKSSCTVPQRAGTSTFVLILPQMDQQPLYSLFDFDVGIWVTTQPGYSWLAATTSHRKAISERPEVYVCPSDESAPFSQRTDEPHLNRHNLTNAAATGSYATVAGSLGAANRSGGDYKYDNNGVFYYRTPTKLGDITDGTSKTMFVGEVVESHTSLSSNIWTKAVREKDCHRSTSNPLNTWPGEPDTLGDGCNGAFASRHPAGANFGFGDGHVEFLEENISLFVYRALSTRSNDEIIDYSE